MNRLSSSSRSTPFVFIFAIGFFLLTNTNLLRAQATWTVEGAAGSAGAENGRAVSTDAAGNVYVTGSFSNTVDFDFGAGTANLTSIGSNDIFIASYTAAGAYRWAVRAGGAGPDNTNPAGAICTDGANVYVTGAYNTTTAGGALFGATTLIPNIAGTGIGTDAFAAKLNASTGAWIWAVSIGGSGNTDFGTSICLDPSGNPYLLGQFNGTLNSCAVTSGGGSELFVSKLNPANGVCVWAASGGSTGNDVVVGGGICYDPVTTELVVASNYNGGTATYGGFTLTNAGVNDVCVLELNSSTGAWLGAVGCGSAATDDAIACAYDPSSGNIMITGAFAGNMTLPGGIALTNTGNNDPWVGSYSESSNTFLWGKSGGGASADRANGIAVDGYGTAIIIGQFITLSCPFGAFTLSNTNAGAFDDIFVVAYSTNTGAELWASKNTNAGGAANANVGKSIAVIPSTTNYWTSGQNASGCGFGALGAIPWVGGNDFYIAKFSAPPPLSATQSQVNLTCNGVCTGSATVVASGGTSPYTYSWSPSGGSGATASSLCATNYTVTITDAGSSSITKTFNITQPPAIVLSANTQFNVACFGGANGAASVVAATGGTGSFTYNWTPGNPLGDGTVSVAGLTAQNYTCTVTDANSCSTTRTFSITQPPAIVVTAASQTNIACFGGSNGAASINTPTGGTPGYTYDWTPGNPTGDGTVSVTGLSAQVYTCSVTDANGCTKTQTFNITAPSTIVVTPASQTNVSCFGGSTGAASINTPTGGSGGYTYDWTPGTPTGDGTVSVNGLTAQVYTCTVTDANGCTKTQTFNITAPSAIVVTPASQTNVSCFGGSTGAASINTPTGGSGGYTYDWTPGTPTGDGTVSVTGLTAQVYTCTVTDANGCTKTQTFNITAPSAIVVTPASQTNVSCFGGSNGAASINTPTGGAGGFTYNWTPGNPTGDGTVSVTGLTAQVYTCNVTDANGCTATQTFNLTSPSTIVVTPASQTNIACFGGSTGSASINTPTGGTPGYTYDWTPGTPTGDGTTTVTGLTAQVYTCTVTDANGCTKTQTFNITSPSTIVVTPASQTNVSCFGGSNGAASINTPTGGAGGYTYDWTPGNPTGDGTVSVTGLTAQVYSCTVTDANGCTKTQTFNITSPSTIVATPASQTNVSCFGGSNGAASINTPTGGAGGFTYNWTPGNPTGDGTVSVTGLTAGSWTCTVTDANSCTTTQTFNITSPSTIVVTPASQTNVSCFGGSNGAASINTPTGGAGGYTYDWTPGNPTGDGTVSVTGLTAQVYSCTVTDANGCTKTQAFNITSPSTIVATPASQTNVSCFGGSNGAASINTPTGGAGGFTYNWTPGNPTGDGTVSVTGLTAGTWTCTVTDANSCTTTQTFNITSPSSIVVTPASQTNVSCFGGSNGAASINTPIGGAGGYTYNWTPGNPTGDGTVSVSGLTFGTWTCTVTDANSCTTTQTFNLTQPTAIAASISSTPTSCVGNTGTATVSGVSGGTPGYTYSWSPTGGTSAAATSLAANTYTCTIIDANGCTITKTITVTTVAGPTLTAASQTNIGCNGNASGAASVNAATGGTSPYSYNWTPGNPTGDGSVSVTGLTAGTWTCTVTDANSCTAIATFNITQPTALVASAASQTNISCNGGTNGAASVTVTGGTAAYSYNWTPGNPTGDGTPSVTGLTFGSWTCTVTDANSCTTTQTFNITQPSALVAIAVSQTNISCNGGSNGAASVSVAGGTAAYSYNWTPGNPTGDGTLSVTGLTFGTWTCTVTDANSCTTTQTFNITQPSALIATAVSQTNISCNGGSNGAASVSVTGGTTAYSYNWTPGNPTGDGTASVTGLTFGTWTCTVTDANSCSSTQTFNITQPTALVATAASQTNISCNAGSNGAASVTVTGGTTAYSYNWTPGNPTGDGTASVTGLTFGTWTCTITDANSCTTTQTFNITQPTAVVASSSTTSILCNGGNATVSVNGTGGTSPYTGTGNFTVTAGGPYSYTVTDNNGCSATTTITVTQPTAVAASSSATSILCNGGNATVSVNGTGGTSPYTGTGTFTVTAGGPYSYTVTDNNGCTATTTITVTQPTVVSASSSATSILCNGGNATVTVNGTGGTSPYTGTGTFTVTAGGPYSYTVTDNNGCTATTTINVTEPTVLVASSSATSILCNGGNATVTVNGTGGTSPYSGTGTFIVTAGGPYSYTVTDNNGCTATTTITVTEPTVLAASSSATSILCNGGNATVTVTETGGTSPYTGDGTFPVTAGGPYTYTVTDNNGCTSTTTITVTQPIVLAASSTATSILCNGGNATVTVTETGGTSPYTGDGTFTVTAGGPYSYTVTDNNGCTSTTTITATEPTAISTSVNEVDVLCNGGATGSIDLTVTGGTGPYTFDWNSGLYTTEDISGLTTGTYVGVITDANGCTDGGSIFVGEPAALVASVTTTTDPTSCGGTDGAVDITVTGGMTAYSFLWSTTATTEDLSAVGAGAYNCTITDANGCTSTTTANLNDPNAPTVTLALGIDTACQTTTAPFALTGESPAGGTFSGPGVTGNTFDPMTANLGINMISYTYTDVNGCTGSTADSIWVDLCMGINPTIGTINFTVMPNPNNGAFMLQLNTTEAADVLIYDALGQLVSKQKVQPKTQQQLNIASSGVYMITVITADGQRSTQRVIVSK